MTSLDPTWPDFGNGFTPAYTPTRMMKLGIFGGAYFQEATKQDFKLMKPGITTQAKLQCGPFSFDRNYFKVKAGLGYTEWVANGWIFDEDPLGWFHWYCRYYSGRRHPRDGHQIRRHQAYVRWANRAQDQMAASGKISPVIQQGLLQWSYHPSGQNKREMMSCA